MIYPSELKKEQDPLRGRIAFGGKICRIKKSKYIPLILSFLYEKTGQQLLLAIALAS